MIKKYWLALIAFVLLIVIFKWIHYIASSSISGGCGCGAKHGGSAGIGKKEGMIDRGTPETSHTIDLPLNNPVSCRNMCINARCSATGQQCLADIDCPGCNPYKPADSPFDVGAKSVPADNDAGKLTVGVTPAYSSLTTDIGSRAGVFVGAAGLGTAPPQTSSNTLNNDTIYAQELYDKRFRPKSDQYPFMPAYAKQPSITGIFSSDGPLPANY